MEIPLGEFAMKMDPRTDSSKTFEYPDERLLPLGEIMSEERLRDPQIFDQDNEPLLLVIKSGNASGVTIGRATGMFSFVRDEDTGDESMAWAIYNYDTESGVFSAPGDSGSIVTSGRGDIGGMITGGAGRTGSSDVTYATPLFWLWPRIKAHFPHAHLYPTAIP